MYEPDSVTWNRISDVWFQKITISKMGLLAYEYHYQTKSSKPCVVIEIATGISRQFAAYALIEKICEILFHLLMSIIKMGDCQIKLELLQYMVPTILQAEIIKNKDRSDC
jgi:hypothetical protein